MINQLKSIFKGYNIRLDGENISLEKERRKIFLSSDEEVDSIIDFYKNSENTVYFIPKHENLILLNNSALKGSNNYYEGFVFSIKLSYIKSIIRKRKIKILKKFN